MALVEAQVHPDNPNRTIYSIVGTSCDDVQLELENLMDCTPSRGVLEAHFSHVYEDRREGKFYAFGVVERVSKTKRELLLSLAVTDAAV